MGRKLKKWENTQANTNQKVGAALLISEKSR